MDFCWRSYILRYPDLKKAGINNYDKAIEHWKMYGKNEGRNGCKIDTKKYSEINPNLQKQRFVNED